MKLINNLCGYLLLFSLSFGNAQAQPSKPSYDLPYDLIRNISQEIRALNILSQASQLDIWAQLDLAENLIDTCFKETYLDGIQKDPEILDLILRVRDGFYRQDGQYFWGMLVTAASSRDERDAFIRGMKFEKGASWFPGWDVAWKKIAGSDMTYFGDTQLKTDIDALEKKLQNLGLAPVDYSKIETEQFDFYEAYLKLFVRFESQLPNLISSLFQFYTNQSLKSMNQNQLLELLQKLNNFKKEALEWAQESRE